ncbi:hypothetical protein MBLNU230_g3011t1 [Neophaeotheca triangularis]
MSTTTNEANPNSLLSRFKHHSLLNTDQSGRRIILQGTISSQPALLLIERVAISTDPSYLSSLTRLITHVQNLGHNDIYAWYLANTLPDNTLDAPTPPDLKLNLIYPCTDAHVRKYSFQQNRSVVETPEIYAHHVRPYMQRYREAGKLNWVFNILAGKAEQENVLFHDKDPRDGFLLAPDLNWDRKTVGALHLLALVERRDLWSLRDLRRSDVPWLRTLKAKLLTETTRLWPEIEEDMLKFYLHYQPTYYHFHIHIVHINAEPTATQAVGKALDLNAIISQLDAMAAPETGSDPSMADVPLTYTVGEASELWKLIFGPLKRGEVPGV